MTRITRRAFTLIDLMIVIVILGVLAAIVLPMFQTHKAEAATAALQTTLRIVKEEIVLYQATNNVVPPNIDPDWFAEDAIPEHPENTIGVAALELATGPAAHPTYKLLKAGVAGAFWYNQDNAAFRARVSDQGTAAETLVYYNFINDAAVASLGNY